MVFCASVEDTMSASRSIGLCAILLVYLCTLTYGSNILAISHGSMSSHLKLISVVMEELVPRGHNVTFLGVLPYKGPLESQITQHILKSDFVNKRVGSISKQMMQDAIDPSKSSSPSDIFSAYLTLYGEQPCTFLKNDVIRNIMTTTVTYDVMILIAYASECFYSIAYMKGIPLILLSPSLLFPWQYISLGIDPYFGIEKSFMLNYPQDSLISRTADIIKGSLLILQRNRIFASPTDKWLQKNYPKIKFPPFYELQKNISLVMINSIPAMGYARTESPTVINIGGIHCRPSQKLPQELDNFISSGGDQGFIYFSLGSTFQTSIVPNYLLNVFLEAFKQLPYRVVMKWNDNSTAIPSNVLALPWLPQQDILGDPRLRAFITQAGILSLIEAVCHRVPVITMPISMDQFANAGQAEKLGYVINLDIKTITTSSLVNAIQTIISDTRFKRSVVELSSAVRDTLNTPQELVTWWTEYVIRNGGTERLKTARQKLPWYQQQQLDVLFLLSSVSLVFVVFCRLAILATCNLIRNLFKIKEKRA